MMNTTTYSKYKAKRQGVERPTGAAKQSDSGRAVGGNGRATTVSYTTCPIVDDAADRISDGMEDEPEGGDGVGDVGVLGTVATPLSSSTPKTRLKKKRGMTPGQKVTKWTREERLWLWECVLLVRRGMTVLGGRQGWTEIHELYSIKGYVPRAKQALLSQLKVIEGGKLTVMEREEVRQKVQKDLTMMFGDSVDESFEGFDESDMSDTIDFAIDVEKVDDGEDDRNGDRSGTGRDCRYVRDGQVLDLEPTVVIECQDGGRDDGRNEDDEDGKDEGNVDRKGERREGRYVLNGQVLDVDPTVVIDRKDTWKEGDGTERELMGEEVEVMEMLRKVRDDGKWEEVPNLRAVERKKVKAEVELVDGVMHNLLRQGMDVTEVNRLLYAGGAVVALRLGLKLGAGKKAAAKKPWWQRRIEKSIEMWRGHLSQVEEVRRGNKVGEKVRAELERKYQLTERGTVSVSTFLKNKIQAGSTKIRWHEDKKGSRRQNNLFRNNQKQLFKELNGDTNGKASDVPDATESRKFWEGIWAVEKRHDDEASWLGDVREQMKTVKQMDDVVVEVEGVKRGIGRMSNWKAPGPDMVRGFWFKKLTSLHLVLTDALKECVQRGEVPGWMVKGRTVLIQKDPTQGRSASNYRPIACLPLMWKLLTGIFADKMYDHLHANSLLPDEQKGCRKQSRGTKDQLLIDREVLKEARRKQRSLSMAWIDYKKAYDMVPHSWILETLRLTGVAENIRNFLERTMADWKTVLTSSGKELGEVGIRRGIFQGDTLSPLLFVVAMIPLSLLLRKESMGYRFGDEGKKINHLLFMDDLKLYGGSREEVDGLVKVVHTFSRDIGMEFGIKKCAVLEIVHGKQVACEGIELPGGEVMREVEESGYKYLGVLEGACIKTKEMKELVMKEYMRRVKLVAGSWLYGGNMMQSVNTWAVSVVRYTAGILEWTEAELKMMDVKTRKMLAAKGALHMKSSVDRLYMKREVGGRGLISVEECVRAEELGLCEYVAYSDEWMLKVVGTRMDGNVEPKLDFKKRMAVGRSDRLKAKKLHGKFFNETKDVADVEKSWLWLRRGSLYAETEGYVCAAQENALVTRNYCATIVKDGGNDQCRVCGKYVETVGHLISACKPMAPTEYRRRHDKMGLRVYWELCGKLGLKRSERWHEETPDPVRRRDDGMTEIWWDQTVSTPKPIRDEDEIRHNRPDLLVIDRVSKRWFLVDFAVPFDANVVKTEDTKEETYKKLAAEVGRMNSVNVKVVPVVVGALGVVSKNLVGWLKVLGIGESVVGELQTAALIGTAAILKKVLRGGDEERRRAAERAGAG